MPAKMRAQKREEEKETTGMVKVGDFPLELIEKIARHLDPKDVREMMMTNKRLYLLYSNDPSIVFGAHVHLMSFDPLRSRIKKFPSSSVLLRDVNHFGHLQSIKRIHSCEHLRISCDVNAGHETILRQLKLVNEVHFYGTNQQSQKFFANFCASIRKRVQLFLWSPDGEEEVESMKEQLGDFIETQLSVTQSLRLAYCRPPTIRAKIVAFLTNYPGMKQIHGDDRWPLYEQAKKLWGENFYDPFSPFSRTDPMSDLDGESWYFRRRIDSAKDCVYILKCAHAYDDSYFFAYYTPAQ